VRGADRDFTTGFGASARLITDVGCGTRGATPAGDVLSVATRARFVVTGGRVLTATEPDAFVGSSAPDVPACRELGRVARRSTATGRADGFPAGAAAVACDQDARGGSGWDTGSATASGSGSTTSAGGAAVRGAATGGAATGGVSTGAGGATTCGGGAVGCRTGSSPSGSTYPSGSEATRMPRWTWGCDVTASALSPTTPTSAPSATVLSRTTVVAPSWSNVTT
jgi:hypothetical protein